MLLVLITYLFILIAICMSKEIVNSFALIIVSNYVQHVLVPHVTLLSNLAVRSTVITLYTYDKKVTSLN